MLEPIVIVDDEVDIHTVTKMSLKQLRFNGEKLSFECFKNGHEAVAYLRQHPMTPLVLMDVVMEAEDAGLIAIKRIREELKNNTVRILMRTGQPGVAPEREVFDHYDIDGYLSKAEMTSNRLYTSVRSALKTHEEIVALQQHRDLLDVLHQSTLKLHRARSMEACMQLLLEITQSAVPSPITWVYLYTPEREEKTHLYYLGQDENTELEAKATALLAAVQADSRRLFVEAPRWFEDGFIVSLDLYHESGFGFLYVEHKQQPLLLSRILPILGSHAMTALESLHYRT